MYDEIVSFCKVCSAPIYGKKIVDRSQWAGPITATHSCNCRDVLLAKIQAEMEAVRMGGLAGRIAEKGENP